jgi:hypothetical protein
MNDLEMTRLCAEAMGLRIVDDFSDCHPSVSGVEIEISPRIASTRYDPLHNDAQAMALAKRFKLNIGQLSDGKFCKVFVMEPYAEGESTDLNRAICECVAKMQQSDAPMKE